MNLRLLGFGPAVITLLPILSGCGGPAVTIKPLPPQLEDLACLPTNSSFEQPSGTDLNTGHAVTGLTVGSGDATQNEFRFIAAGGPGDGVDDHGMVTIIEADPMTGLTMPGSLKNQIINGAFNQFQFGWAVHAADIRECHPGPFSPLPIEACGAELLVGAPDNGTHTTPGMVDWFEPARDLIGALQYGGTVYAPASASASAEFGSAIAAWSPTLDPSRPWEVAPNPVSWVAIGAPGDDEVHIYAIDPANTNPFGTTPVLTLPAPFPGQSFGSVLTAGDFDGDGIGDLAVGAPDAAGTPDGRTYVFRGLSGGGAPLYAAALTLDGFLSEPLQPDEFGAALAAGSIVGDWPGDGLAVGAPGMDGGNGGVCVYRLADDGPNRLRTVDHRCERSPASTSWSSSYLLGGRYGESLATGNFSAVDSNGLEDTDEARRHELAVGAPGANGDDGVVMVFLSDEQFPDFSALVVEESNPALGGTTFTGSSGHYGAAVATSYVQETQWADLVSGAPEMFDVSGDDGLMALSRAEHADSSCLDVTGHWLTTDDAGNTVRLRIFVEPVVGTTHVTFLDPFTVSILDSTGAVCQISDGDGGSNATIFDLPVGTELELDAAFPCTGTCSTNVWTNQDASALVDAVLDSMGGSMPGGLSDPEMDVTLDFMPASSTCNGTTTDMVSLDLSNTTIEFVGFRIGVFGALAAVDGFFTADCAPNTPIVGDLDTRAICE